MAKQQEALTLSTSAPRRFVTIDGKKIRMLHPSELPLAATVRLRLALAAFCSEKGDEKSAASLSQSLVLVVRDIMPSIPKEIDRKLCDEQRVEIIASFFEATGKPAPTKARQPAN